MVAVAFFGHRDFDYSPYRDKIKSIITHLIEDCGADTFFNGFRGNFDKLCAEVVFSLKDTYPHIKNIMVLSYLNIEHFVLPKYFDESVYLLEKSILPQYAILYTNQEIVLRSDYIISGVKLDFGGAYTACEFAKRKKKIILNIFENN